MYDKLTGLYYFTCHPSKVHQKATVKFCNPRKHKFPQIKTPVNGTGVLEFWDSNSYFWVNQLVLFIDG